MVSFSTDCMGKHLEVSEEKLAFRCYWWFGVLYPGVLNVSAGELYFLRTLISFFGMPYENLYRAYMTSR